MRYNTQTYVCFGRDPIMNTLCASIVCFITLQLSPTHLSTKKGITIIDTTEKTVFIYVSSATIKERKCDLSQSKAAGDIALVAGSFRVSPVTEWAEFWKGSCCFKIRRWPMRWFFYQWRHDIITSQQVNQRDDVIFVIFLWLWMS